MNKLIHKPTRIKPPSATLLDNIYTNIPLTVDNCKSGILISDISDHFIVFGMLNMKISLSQEEFSMREIFQNLLKISVQ